jgi:hypothetical protein
MVLWSPVFAVLGRRAAPMLFLGLRPVGLFLLISLPIIEF